MRKYLRNKTFQIYVILLFAFAIRLFLIFQPFENVINLIKDDAGYYLNIVKNFAHIGLFSFDGIEITNGFHLLYFFILFISYSLTQELLRTSLVILSIFNILTGYILYILLKYLKVNEKIAIFALFFYLFNPMSIFIAFNGVEAQIMVFFISLSLLFLAKYLKEKKDFYLFILGIFAGFAFLSRTDSIFFIFSLLFYILIIKREIITSIKFIGSVSPFLFFYIAFQYLFFGRIFQDSFKAIFFASHMEKLIPVEDMVRVSITFLFKVLEHGFSSMFLAIFFIFFCLKHKFDYKVLLLSIILSFSFLLKLFGFFEIYAIIILLTIFSFFIVFIKINKKIIGLLKDPINFIIFLYCLALFIFYSFYLIHLQEWYFAIFVFLISFIVFRIIPSKIFEKNSIKILLGISIIFSFKFVTLYYLAQNDCEISLYEAGIWIKHHTSTKEIIGAFDSGIIGFVSNRTVINLDGVVNPSVLLYLENEDLFSYIKKRNITIVIDTRGYFSKENECLQEIKKVKQNNCKPIVIYKVAC